MSSVALAPAAVNHPAVNTWLVATAVVIPTFMEILDTWIATASMRYIRSMKRETRHHLSRCRTTTLRDRQVYEASR